jgi:hypothetical protein
MSVTCGNRKRLVKVSLLISSETEQASPVERAADTVTYFRKGEFGREAADLAYGRGGFSSTDVRRRPSPPNRRFSDGSS